MKAALELSKHMGHLCLKKTQITFLSCTIMNSCLADVLVSVRRPCVPIYI